MNYIEKINIEFPKNKMDFIETIQTLEAPFTLPENDFQNKNRPKVTWGKRLSTSNPPSRFRNLRID